MSGVSRARIAERAARAAVVQARGYVDVCGERSAMARVWYRAAMLMYAVAADERAGEVYR